MDHEHSFLQSAWESEDATGVLLVFADFLDEGCDSGTGELLRLLVAESGTARHSKERAARLRRLRDEARKSVGRTAWPSMAVQGLAGAASFFRQPDPAHPASEHIVVRPERRTIHWLRTDLDGQDEVVGTRAGLELLRRPSPLGGLGPVAVLRDAWAAGFTLADDYFPLPDGWRQDPETALAGRQRRLDAALAPAEVRPCDLPAELVPHAAWVLCEHLCDKGRLARAGILVPGHHVFCFRTGPMRWLHQEAVANGVAGGASAILRKRVRTSSTHSGSGRAGGDMLAGLLVRVADDGLAAARKLAWLGPGGEVRETANPRKANATLAADDFLRILADPAVAGRVMARPARDRGGLEERFVAGTQERLRALFASQAATSG